MKKILFVNYDFEIGGIRTSMVNFLDELSKNEEYDISVLFLNGDEPKKGELPDNVHIEKTPFIIKNCFSSLKKTKERKNVFGLAVYFFSRAMNKLLGKAKNAVMFSKLGKIKQEYDYAIAFANDSYSDDGKQCLLCGCNQFVTNAVKAKKKLAWIHSMSSQIGYTSKNVRDTYKPFDGIVNCNIACKQIFDDILPVYKEKSFYINNILNEKRILSKSTEKIPFEKNVFNIVTVGRVKTTKFMDRIVPIVKLLADMQVPEFVWHVVGDGSYRQEMEDEIRRFGLEKYIVMHGMQENPYPFISNADLYVQTSDHEAMPMVVMEAKLFGVPLVSTNYPAATEMIPENCGIVCKKEGEALIEELACSIDYMIQHRQDYNDVKLVQYGMDQFVSVLEKV